MIESLVGRSFLPRGIGIVTRRPLILQLVNTGPNQDESYSQDDDDNFPSDDDDGELEWFS